MRLPPAHLPRDRHGRAWPGHPRACAARLCRLQGRQAAPRGSPGQARGWRFSKPTNWL